MSEITRVKTARIDALLSAYKAALREWIDAIRTEMELASCNSTVGETDRWERACDVEEEARIRARALRSEYESALRQEFYHF